LKSFIKFDARYMSAQFQKACARVFEQQEVEKKEKSEVA